MKNFKKPYEIVSEKGVQFVLFDGTVSKVVFEVLAFDKYLGVFPIVNKDKEIVEYMDIVGNFTKKPTKFAQEFYSYICSNNVGYGYPCFTFYTALLDFPSKYLTDTKIRKIVKNHENYKIQEAKQNGEFNNLFEILRFKLYSKSIYNQKIAKADKLQKRLNEKQEVENNYYER